MDFRLRDELDKQASQLIAKIAYGTATDSDVARLQSVQISSIQAARFTRDMALAGRKRPAHTL